MKNKVMPMAMSAVLSLSACGPQKETIREIIRTEKVGEEKPQAAEVPSFLPFWEQIASGTNPNPALARLLMPYLSEDERAVYTKSVPFEAKALQEVERDRQEAKDFLLFRGLGFKKDPSIVGSTLNVAVNKMSFSARGIRDDLNLNLQIQRQNQAMESLLKTYADRAQKLATEMMPAWVERMSPDDQKKLSEIVKGSRVQAIERTIEVLKKYDGILSAYNFHSEDNTKIVVVGMVAGALVDYLLKNPDVQSLIRGAQQVADIAGKVREAAALVELVQESRHKLSQDWQNAKYALKEIGKEIKSSQIEMEFQPETRVEALRFMSDALTGNLQSSKQPGPLSRPQIVNKNIETFVNSAASAAGRLDSILNATETLAGRLGIKIDPGVQSAIDTARTVTSAVNLAQSVMSAYSSGGLIGALGMVAGGPGPALMGAVAGAAIQAEMAADIKAIKRELAEIKQLQKEMIEIQLETMKMIREVAVLVESFHKEEMAEIRSVKSLVLQQIEAQSILTHSEVIACEKMLQYGVGTKGRNNNAYRMNNVRTAGLTDYLLRTALNEKGALARFVRSSSETNFEECQRAMTLAFGNTSAAENPVQLAANAKGSELASFYTDVYAPLMSLAHNGRSVSYPVLSMGLHLPTVNANALMRKVEYAKRELNNSHEVPQVDLRNLISTDGLERYIESLLVFHPILAFDKIDWMMTGKDANQLKEQYEVSWSRSVYWLQNALSIVQSAIAQESLVVGEPLLPVLSEKLAELSGMTDCGGRVAPAQELACAIRRNNLLSENLLKFVVHQRVPVQQLRVAYAVAYAERNIPALESRLGADFVGKIKVRESKNEKFLVFTWQDKTGIYETRMPSPNAVIEGEIKYTGNMKRLLTLQDKVIEAYLEVTPMMVDEKVQKQVRKMMMVR